MFVAGSRSTGRITNICSMRLYSIIMGLGICVIRMRVRMVCTSSSSQHRLPPRYSSTALPACRLDIQYVSICYFHTGHIVLVTRHVLPLVMHLVLLMNLLSQFCILAGHVWQRTPLGPLTCTVAFTYIFLFHACKIFI